jgi:hypothetical protein
MAVLWHICWLSTSALLAFNSGPRKFFFEATWKFRGFWHVVKIVFKIGTIVPHIVLALQMQVDTDYSSICLQLGKTQVVCHSSHHRASDHLALLVVQLPFSPSSALMSSSMAVNVDVGEERHLENLINMIYW